MKLLLFFLSTLAACSSTPMSEPIQSVELSQRTRGYQKVITVTEQQTQVSINDKVYSRKTQPQQWKKILEEFQQIKLVDLPSLKTSTKGSQVDAAYITQLTVKTDKQTYQSNTFDHDTPPHALAAVIKTLNASVSGLAPAD